jgi:tight adherence protein C
MLVLALIALTAAFFLVAEVVSLPARERRAHLRRVARYGRTRPVSATRPPLGLRDRALAALVRETSELMLRTPRHESLEELQLHLERAGIRSFSARALLAAKALAAVGGLLLGLAAGIPTGRPAIVIAPLALGAAGYALPQALLALRARRRRERALAQLPDALDLLAIGLEAGLGLDGAIGKLAEHMRGPLVEELELCRAEMRLGSSAPDALRRLALRLPAPEVAAFVRSLNRAEQLGLSLGRIVRVQAADTRLRRQAAAEEQAAQAPMLILLTTLCLIAPAIAVVVLGPTLLRS